MNLTGSKQLAAASGVLPTVTSAAFTVSSAAATALTFVVGPSSVVAGVAIAPAVQVKVSDAFGNGVPARSVSLALVGSGTLSGGGAVLSDAAGLATFSGASVNLVGSKQLTATSGVLPTVTSAAFSVSPATAAALTFAVAPSNVAAGAAIAPAIQVKVSDAFGNGIAGQLISMSLVGTGTLSGGGAVASDAAGLVTFPAASVNLSGSKQLTAASGVLPSVTSAAFTVSSAAATALTFAVGPSTVVAGVAIAPAVQVKVSDAFGNGVPARSVSLALAGTGTLTGGGAVVSDAAGLATFPALSVDLAGSKQLTAASGVLPTVTSAAFIVSPAAAVALAFAAGPSNVVAGVAIAPAVQVKVSDAFGNGVPAKSVSLALVGTGTLSGGGAVVSDAAGLATFSGASVNLVGSKQLIATSGVLPAVTSAAFGVSPATAAALTFVVGPSNVVAGVAIAPAVQVKVSDAFGNGIAGQLISMSLVGTGTLSGGSAVTSDAAGLVSFAALSVNLSGSKQLTAASGVLPTVTSAAFTVACPVITLPAFALPDAKRGVAYSQSFTASGGTGPYRYTVTTGALPAGLVLSTAGSLSGTPTVTGTASFTVSATDAFNCTGATSYTLSVFIDPAISLILPVTTGLCVSTSQPCVTVPFVYQRGEASAARSAHVVFQLDSRFALCTPATPTTSIRAGSWLSTFTNTTFQVTDNGAGSYTVDLSLTGLPCGQTAGGTLFTVDVAGVGGDGIGNLTVTACRTLDCSSLPLPAQPGAPAPLNLDHVSPGRITDLASAQIAPVVVAGGATDSLATLRLTWTPSPSNIISIYRAPFGTYPEYDDLGGTLPDSAAAPAAPWVLVSASATSPFVDRPPVRGSWHYVAFVADSCGNRAAVSNLTQGSLDYLLGDVSDKVTRGVGNDRVGVEDVSLLASHYGLSGAQIVTANVAYLDVGPTLDGTVNSRPTTDDLIDFQDLAIFSLNFKVTPFGASARPAAPPAPSDGLETFELRAPAIVGPGADVPVVLHVAAAGAMQAFSVQLAWNPFVVQPIDMASGGFVESQGGIVLSARAGDVDAALLGVGEHGMLGSGDVATLHFHVIREGDPGLRIANLIARDASNRPVDPARLGDAVVAAPPAHTLLLAPTPNPARDAATLAFGLAQRGSVDLGLYAVDGRRVRTLAHGLREPGVYRITWKGDDDGGHSQGPGVYWARLTADGRTFTRRLVYLK